MASESYRIFAIRFSLGSPLMRLAFFNFRARSLLRGTLFVLASLLVAFVLSGFPHARPEWQIAFPAFAALWGTYETLRCLQLRWSFYHGGVLLLLYMDVMALSMIFFLLLYPYASN